MEAARVLQGVGLDLELIRDICVERNFTPQELVTCNSKRDCRASLAGRWCAKEALVKALLAALPVKAAPSLDIEVVMGAADGCCA